MKNNIDSFIGIFPNAFTPDYCNKVIKWFEQNNKEGNKYIMNTWLEFIE
jgi:hypothetical protein|tara:strand:+ start:204 stop:350 length:147 start_codon:yes stop_codon:yes gene_type:complete